MKNINVFGLPRSGTNFLEYMLRYYVECELPEINGNSKYIKRDNVAIKHCEPNNELSDIQILIIKSWVNFLPSYIKWDKKSDIFIKQAYILAMDDYLKFYLNNQENCVIIFYEDLLNNEEEFLNYLSETFQINFIKKFKVPKKRMDRNSGKSTNTQDFNISGVILDKKNTLNLINVDEILKYSWKSKNI